MDGFYHTALVADALSLGAHWIYNQEEIVEVFPKGVRKFADPMTEYHKGKKAGDQTHYGDQAVMLWKSIKKREGFDAEGWREDWVAEMGRHGGYVDGASKETLKSEGKVASQSSDLGGASRIAPILDLKLPLNDAVAAVRSQTALTHGDPAVADAAEFFTRAAYVLKAKAAFEDALEAAAEEGTYVKLNVAKHVETARSLRDEIFPGVAKQIGQACVVDQAFPLALYFLLRPQTDFEKTMSDNIMAGGDSAARGMLISLLFAAVDPNVAAEWKDGLRAH